MSSNIESVVSAEMDVFGGTTDHTAVFKVLSSQSCRYLIYYFLAASDASVSIEDVVTGIQTLAAHDLFFGSFPNRFKLRWSSFSKSKS